MSITNTFTLDVDFKKSNYMNEPVVTQNDEVTFILNIYDDDERYDLSNVTTFTLASVRPDKTSVMTLGTKTATNQVTFNLGTTELEVVGRVKAAIQLYDAEGRVSTLPFSFKVLKDPVIDYVPSTNEQTLIELVLGEAPTILANAEKATTDINDLNTTVTAQETTRDNNENSRKNAESVRQSNENNRELAENERQSTFDNQMTSINTATTNATTQANYAKEQAEYAKSQGNFVQDVLDAGWYPIRVETFTSNAGQTLFTLNGTYVTGQNRLQVIIGGVRQYYPLNFTETSNKSFTVSEPLVAGLDVEVIYQ